MYFKNTRNIINDYRLLRYAPYMQLTITSSVHVFEGNEPVNVIPSRLSLKISFRIKSH